MPIKILRHTIVRDEIIETTTEWKDVSHTTVEILPEAAFPARTADMLYYQHGDSPLKLWQSGEQAPTDGSLHLNIANSIDGNNDQPNSSVIGTDWQPMPDGLGMHLWWNHAYGKSAGTRVVFSRYGWKPLGLEPLKGKMVYALLDFMAPHIPMGAPFAGGWLTWPFELKINPYGPAAVQSNVNSKKQLVWATAEPGLTYTVNTPFQLVGGQTHRLRMEIGGDSFEATLDGNLVARATAVPTLRMKGDWEGIACFIPCLYGNQLAARMDGYIPNLIVSGAPIP